MFYKLTDENGSTYGGMQWGEEVKHTASGEGGLCGPGWIHYYDDPLLAVLLNTIHANFVNPQLWEVEVSGKTLMDRGLKFGSTGVKTLKRIPLPTVTTTQRVAFGILCVLEVTKSRSFREWAECWISGEDRSEAAGAAGAAWAATWAAAGAAWAAAGAAAGAAPVGIKSIAKKCLEVM